MKSLLILGEHNNPELNLNINRLRRASQESGLQTTVMSYEQLLRGPVKPLKTEDASVMLFFPFTFWDSHCELPDDSEVYGVSKERYLLFANFWSQVSDAIEHHYADHNLSFVVNPKYAAVDRDKILTREMLQLAGLPVTTTIPKDPHRIIAESESPDRGVFIKSRYGSEGKGITYLRNGKWLTNYQFDGQGHVLNPADNNWQFRDFSGNSDFLRNLLDLEVIVEKEVVPPVRADGKKSDVRSYVVMGNTEYLFVRENGFDAVITNFSQGGYVNDDSASVLPPSTINAVKNLSVQSANALYSGFIGVDFMFDKDWNHPLVLEAQTFPGYPKIRKCNLARKLVERVLEE